MLHRDLGIDWTRPKCRADSVMILGAGISPTETSCPGYRWWWILQRRGSLVSSCRWLRRGVLFVGRWLSPTDSSSLARLAWSSLVPNSEHLTCSDYCSHSPAVGDGTFHAAPQGKCPDLPSLQGQASLFVRSRGRAWTAHSRHIPFQVADYCLRGLRGTVPISRHWCLSANMLRVYFVIVSPTMPRISSSKAPGSC